MKNAAILFVLLCFLVACKSQGRAFDLSSDEVAKSEVVAPPPVLDAKDLPKTPSPGQFGEEDQKWSHFDRSIEKVDGRFR